MTALRKTILGIALSVLAVIGIGSAQAQVSGCPIGSTTRLGCYKVDGITITVNGGVISAIGAAAGSIQVGVTNVTSGTSPDLLFNNAGKLGNETFASACTSATTSVFGCVKVDGSTITISSGVISSTGGGGVGNPGITFTGTLVSPFKFTVTPSGTYLDGTFTGTDLTATYVGVDQPTLLTLSISNINALGTFSPTMTNLTTLTLNSLPSITGNFSPTLNSLTTLSINSMTSIAPGGSFSPTMNAMTTLDLHRLTIISGVFGPVMNALTSLDLSGLANLDASLGSGDFFPTMPALTTLDLSALTTMGSFSPIMDALTSLNLSALTIITGSGAGFHPEMNALTTLSLPALTTVDTGCTFDGTFNSLTTLNLPALTTINGFTTTAPALTTLNLSSLTTIAGFGFNPTMPALTTLNLSGLTNVTGNVQVMGAALNQASVNNLLVTLAGISPPVTGIIIDLSGGTSATPTGTGAAAKTILQGQGNTVNTN